MMSKRKKSERRRIENVKELSNEKSNVLQSFYFHSATNIIRFFFFLKPELKYLHRLGLGSGVSVRVGVSVWARAKVMVRARARVSGLGSGVSVRARVMARVRARG